MRDWNRGGDDIYCKNRGFKAYLWGIETNAGRKTLLAKFYDLKPTYEGLKQKLRDYEWEYKALFKAYLWGIETVTSLLRPQE